jgi:hypothetical protein
LLVVLAATILALLACADTMAATRPSVSLGSASATGAVGAPVTLSGIVKNPRAGAPSVVVMERAGARWRPVGTAKLAADGAFVVEVTPGKAGTWDLVAQYKAGRLKVRSRILALEVHDASAGWSLGACGGSGMVALTGDHALWTWGGNDAGQLGMGTSDA